MKPTPLTTPPPTVLTPETTPIPGGGSWRWTDAGWVSNDVPAELSAPTTTATPTPNPTAQPE